MYVCYKLKCVYVFIVRTQVCVCFQIGVYVINIESFRYNLESFRSKNVSMMSYDDVARPQYIVNAVPLIHIIWKRTVYVIGKRVCTLSTLRDEVCVRFQLVCTFSIGLWVHSNEQFSSVSCQ